MNNSGQQYTYETFALQVGNRQKRGYPLRVIQAPAGDVRALCRLDPNGQALQSLLRTLESDAANEALLLQLGDRLFTDLFVGDIAALYHASLNMVRSQGKQLRLHLNIEPPELAALPWEFLYDKQEDLFLAISPETAVVRYIPIQTPVHPTAIKPPLRLLVVVANPQDLQPLHVEREQALIQEALAEWTSTDHVQLRFLEHATLAGIGQAMRDFRPHVFHFIGHSTVIDEQAYILLTDESGRAKGVNERIFREFFTGFPETRLAVLNACQTATAASNQLLAGLAPRLLQRQLSAVVAMQYPILDTLSLVFTREFYRSLVLGSPLEAAISEARRGIYLEVGGQRTDWGAPVLFLRAQSGYLFQVDGATEAETQPEETKEDPREPLVTVVNHSVMGGGDFVGRDKTIHGDVVQGDKIAGDKIAGNKTTVHIERVEAGAQVIIGDQHITQAPPVEIPPPPETERPPEPAGFVGRQAELAYYAERLQSTHFAAICGMAGVGKSALAAVLAKQIAAPDKIFWHSFHGEEGFEPILWQLAGFLARHGQSELWQMLHTVWQTRRESLPPATLFNYLLQLLRGQDYLICLDDFQFVDEDPLVRQLVERLGPLLAAGEVTLLLTARRVPNFIQVTGFAALNGLSLANMCELLAARGLTLSDALATELHSRTEGNAQLLTLAIEALRRTTEPARLLARLAETVDIERYLMHEVDEGLTNTERAVMNAVALLLGYFGTRAAIEAIVDGDNIPRTLHELSSRYLLVIRETEVGREYGQHATLQAFYYDLLDQRTRVAMHQRAGDYYTQREVDFLKAARHYQNAGAFRQAADIVVPQLWTIINQSQGQALRLVLERFTAQQLDAQQWAQVNLARGELYTLLGEGELARESFERVLSVATTPATPESAMLRLQVYEGMGWLLEQESPQQALDWLQRGLQEVTGAGNLAEATLYIRIGSVQSAVGEFTAALQSLQHGLALLPATPSQLRASALLNIGNIYSAQGDLQQGSDYYQQALAISEQLHDDFRILAIRSNLAIDKEIAGDWPGAITDYKAALALAEHLGSTVDQARLANSLGTIYTKRGDVPQAASYLERAITTARKHENREDLAYSLTSLADLKARLDEMAIVAASLTEAEQLAHELNLESLEAEIHCLWAQYYLQRGELRQATVNAERAVRSAQELDLKVEKGKFLRTLARSQAARGQAKRALTTIAKSLALLADHDPYEAACTKLAWGELLLMKGAVADGRRRLQEAQSTFQTLEANRDLLVVKRLLQRSHSQED